jgi:isopentenyl diphosphate isomerase/L-lactate dehydrogenase-like FMN-dependent dehydrogenase
VVRAVALGADAAFAGKAFLWGLGALGAEGPLHVIDLMIDEMRAAVGQLGVTSLNALRSLQTRHPGAIDFGHCQGK